MAGTTRTSSWWTQRYSLLMVSSCWADKSLVSSQQQPWYGLLANALPRTVPALKNEVDLKCRGSLHHLNNELWLFVVALTFQKEKVPAASACPIALKKKLLTIRLVKSIPACRLELKSTSLQLKMGTDETGTQVECARCALLTACANLLGALSTGWHLQVPTHTVPQLQEICLQGSA